MIADFELTITPNMGASLLCMVDESTIRPGDVFHCYRALPPTHTKFALGDAVEKTKGSSWHGRVVGWYSTSLTSEGYCVESARHPGSVQIYPRAALAPWLNADDEVSDGV
jgi:dihydrofolate reductase (trimethoprim resistance protein)